MSSNNPSTATSSINPSSTIKLYVRQRDNHEIITLTADINANNDDNSSSILIQDANDVVKYERDIPSLHLHLQSAASNKKSLLTALPPEVIIDSLLPLLTTKEICTLSHTCCTLYRYCMDESIWNIIAERYGWLHHAQRAVQENHEYLNVRLYCIDRQHMTCTFKELWQRIYDKLDVENQRSLRRVTNKNREAVTKSIEQLESILHRQLPLAFTLSLLHYDGQSEYIIRGRGVVYGCRLLSINKIIHSKTYSALWKDNESMLPVTDEAGLIRYAMDARGKIYQLMGLHMHDTQYRAINWYQFIRQLMDPHNRL